MSGLNTHTRPKILKVSWILKERAMPTDLTKLTAQVARLKLALRRVSNQRDYFKRQFHGYGYEAMRKAAWRKKNPKLYRAALDRIKLRARKWLGRPHHCPNCQRIHRWQGRFCCSGCQRAYYVEHGPSTAPHKTPVPPKISAREGDAPVATRGVPHDVSC